MARELKLLLTCVVCGFVDFATDGSEGECEKNMERRGWLVMGTEKCPACKSGRKKQLKGEGK